MRSINTGLVALLPVGGLLFIGAGLLGAGTLKDLGLVLFIGMGVAVYSSIFFATPVLADLKEPRAAPAGARAAGAGPARRRAARRSRPPAGAAPSTATACRSAGRAERPSSPARHRGRAPARAPVPARRSGPGRRQAGGSRPALRPRQRTHRSPRHGRRFAAAPVPTLRRSAGGSPVRDRGAGREAQVVDVPDFPKPGILFKDLMPLFADGPAFRARDRRDHRRARRRAASTWSPASRRAAS